MDKIVYQHDAAGYYVGQTSADQSPLEEDVYHLPARCVEEAPPVNWDEGQWPRWDGAAWRIVNKPQALTEDPVQKLRTFLAANPDVASLIAG